MPSHWEFHGFGTYNYGTQENPSDEQGKYRHTFRPPAAWTHKKVFLVFEGSMTDTEVWINEKPAGPVHQGSFYRFRYDVTDLLNFKADNLLEATVSKVSANPSVNNAERSADYWIFGGIYRPVYLEALPSQFIEHCATNPRADGSLIAEVFYQNLTDADRLVAQILDAQGNPFGDPIHITLSAGQKKSTLRTEFTGHKIWTAESPHLYTLKLSLMRGDNELHTTHDRFGFRTIEIRPGHGVFINGKKIKFKGVCRHTFWPDSGRATSRRHSLIDVKLMKQMNMNAVRMSHYQPDDHFLDVCDELGLYVLDELAGWWGHYGTQVGKKLVKEFVDRDVNHPSVIFWNNGNETGWNYDLDGEFGQYDPQGRTVLHPYAGFKPPNPFNAINTDHYRSYPDLQQLLQGAAIVMPTELLHGLYDGGHGAGLDDFWKLMLDSPVSAGCFLWDLADEGVVRTDQNDRIDAFGNQAPDGILGPYREKEGSFYTIKEIWSPVHITMEKLPTDFSGQIQIDNRYDFTNLDQCTFQWQLAAFPAPGDAQSGHRIVHQAGADAPSIPPQQTGTLNLKLSSDWKESDALYLTASDPQGRQLWTWAWNLKSPLHHRQAIVKESSQPIEAQEDDTHLSLNSAGMEFTFLKITGQLVQVKRNGDALPTLVGPQRVPGPSSDEAARASQATSFRHYPQGTNHIIEVENTGGFHHLRWTLAGDWLGLEYAFNLTRDHEFIGITFDYPEEGVKGIKWLGRGPYRVWKNRTKGPTLDVWTNAHNNNIPGATWNFPEFKGYFANLHWARLDTDDGPLIITTDTDDLFLRLFTPQNGPDPQLAEMRFPPGDISFLHGINSVGTKFTATADLGPQSQPNTAAGSIRGTLYFQFSNP